jgi:N-acetylhexosamine 1-kinase
MSSGIQSAARAIHEIAALFDLNGPVKVFDFAEKGNINLESYLVAAGSSADRKEYILQLLNPDVFSQPRRVMDAMIACIKAQQKALSEGLLENNDEWEPIRLVPTKEGSPYLEIPNKEGLQCWRMMARFPNVCTYRRLGEIGETQTRLRVAEEAARGMALFRILTADMDVSQIESPLPGYRDTRLYYDQLLSVLAGNRTPAEAGDHLPLDPIVRESTERHYIVHSSPAQYRRRLEDPQLTPFIAVALEQRSFALMLVEKLACGELQKAVIHGDTKLENFLFSSSSGRVKSIIDLDTVMPHTWLTDWGDMVRSLVNTAGETESDPERIEIDPEVFSVAARGFLGSARYIDPQEIELMADAPQIMALELGVRFLADYLRGDSYFKLRVGDPEDLNKTRALVQFRVFEGLRRAAASARVNIEELSTRFFRAR